MVTGRHADPEEAVGALGGEIQVIASILAGRVRCPHLPHVRRAEQVVEHVRMRIAQQICGDLAEGGPLHVLRLGNRWDLAFHQSLKRDAKGEIRFTEPHSYSSSHKKFMQLSSCSLPISPCVTQEYVSKIWLLRCTSLYNFAYRRE